MALVGVDERARVGEHSEIRAGSVPHDLEIVRKPRIPRNPENTMKALWIYMIGALAFALTPTVWAQQAEEQEPDAVQESQIEAKDHADLFKGMTLPTGPMRVEPWSITETRNYYKSDPPPTGVNSTLSLRTKLTGDRLVYLAGRGEMIIEEMVDDTGKVLLSINDVPAKELTAVYPLRAGKRMLQAGYTALNVNAQASARGATKLKSVKGYLNVVYAKQTEEIVIDNPLRFVGGLIEHPKLQEIGIKIKVLDPEAKARPTSGKPTLGLQFLDNSDKYIRKMDFYDAWLKPLYARERPMETPEGEAFTLYSAMAGKFDADTQLVIRYYPKIEEEKIPFEFTDLELP